MMRVIRMAQYANEGQQRATAAWQALNTQPSWVVKATIAAFVLVVGVPIVLLLVFAFFVSAVLFGVLWCVNQVIGGFRGALPQREGRENVRVIRRGEEQ